MTDDQDFEKFYAEKIAPGMGELKEVSGNALAWYRGIWISGFLAFASFIAWQTHFFEGGLLLFFVFFVIGVICFFKYDSSDYQYENSFRERVLKEMLEHILPGTTYEPDKSINEVNYKRSCLSRYPFTEFVGKDFMKGAYNGVTFHSSEIEVMDGNASSTITIFKGLFIIIPINSCYSGGTYIWARGGEQLPSSIMDEEYRLMPMPRIVDVHFNDEKFNEYYRVCSTYPAEAQELLTPEVRSNMVWLTEGLDMMIAFSYVAGTFNVAAPFPGNLFGPADYTPDDKEEIKHNYNRIKLIPQVIDKLGLYNLQ